MGRYQLLELFLPACRAIQHAHQKGVIHRDIKPSNILVSLDYGEPTVKVIDFGVAKAIGPRLTERTLVTQFAQMIGTPAYMSPEQAEMSNLDVDTRASSDSWLTASPTSGRENTRRRWTNCCRLPGPEWKTVLLALADRKEGELEAASRALAQAQSAYNLSCAGLAFAYDARLRAQQGDEEGAQRCRDQAAKNLDQLRQSHGADWGKYWFEIAWLQFVLESP